MRRIIVMDKCDAATQLAFFMTCRAHWFGDPNSRTAPCYARDKRPSHDVGYAVARHGYARFYRFLVRQCSPAWREFVPIDVAIVHRHELLRLTIFLLSSPDPVRCTMLPAYTAQLETLANTPQTKHGATDFGTQRDVQSRAFIAAFYAPLNMVKTPQDYCDFRTIHGSTATTNDKVDMIAALMLRPDADWIFGSHTAWAPFIWQELYDTPGRIAWELIFLALAIGKPYMMYLVVYNMDRALVRGILGTERDDGVLKVHSHYAYALHLDKSGTSMAWIANEFSKDGRIHATTAYLVPKELNTTLACIAYATGNDKMSSILASDPGVPDFASCDSETTCAEYIGKMCRVNGYASAYRSLNIAHDAFNVFLDHLPRLLKNPGWHPEKAWYEFLTLFGLKCASSTQLRRLAGMLPANVHDAILTIYTGLYEPYNSLAIQGSTRYIFYAPLNEVLAARLEAISRITNVRCVRNHIKRELNRRFDEAALQLQISGT